MSVPRYTDFLARLRSYLEELKVSEPHAYGTQDLRRGSSLEILRSEGPETMRVLGDWASVKVPAKHYVGADQIEAARFRQYEESLLEEDKLEAAPSID